MKLVKSFVVYEQDASVPAETCPWFKLMSSKVEMFLESTEDVTQTSLVKRIPSGSDTLTIPS